MLFVFHFFFLFLFITNQPIFSLFSAGFQKNIFAKSYILDVWKASKDTSEPC